MSTVEPIVLPGPLAWRPLPAQARRRWPPVALAVLGALVLLVPLASAFITLPYYAIAPGSARQVNDLIRVAPDHSYPPRGKFLLTTVSLGRVTVLEAVGGWLDKDVDVKPEREVIGSTPPARFQQLNIQAMDTSKQTAVVVALQRLGYDVKAQGHGALIEAVVESSPAHRAGLEAGSVIVAVDGRPVTLGEEAVAGIHEHEPGDTVHFDVEDQQTHRTRGVDVALDANPQNKKVAYLGVQLSTKGLRFDLPFDVHIDSAGIGGPSAGLAFTLGVIDELSPGELTGGQRIAVTGEIHPDGSVGDVGGVAQKTAAVRRSGARIFLVPPGEYDTARAHAGRNLRVIKVATLEQALRALGRVGGDLAALGPPSQTQSR